MTGPVVGIGRGLGKLILFGEHAVVAGHPAIAAAVDRGTTVTLTRRPGASAVDTSPIVDPRLWPALATLVPADGVGVNIVSDLPVGCGMGSSAALAVALVRALAAREGRVADFETCFRQAFVVERVFHGNPSGVDHAVSALGGVVRYRREGPEIVPLPAFAPLRLVVANTGTPGNTAAMVEQVRRRGAAAEFAAIATVVGEAERRWPDLGALLSENHRLLRAIGVSTPVLDRTCAAMEAAGARGAKLAGAGGGGVCFALVDPDREADVTAAAQAAGCTTFATWVG